MHPERSSGGLLEGRAIGASCTIRGDGCLGIPPRRTQLRAGEGTAGTLVTDEAAADLTVSLTSPSTTHELCKPTDVGFAWNCSDEKRVVLNSDRWRFMTPTYDDLGAYRAYLVNHEVGSFLGQGVATCPKPGANAPVMMQQGIDLGGCLPNAWPRDAD